MIHSITESCFEFIYLFRYSPSPVLNNEQRFGAHWFIIPSNKGSMTTYNPDLNHRESELTARFSVCLLLRMKSQFELHLLVMGSIFLSMIPSRICYPGGQEKALPAKMWTAKCGIVCPPRNPSFMTTLNPCSPWPYWIAMFCWINVDQNYFIFYICSINKILTFPTIIICPMSVSCCNPQFTSRIISSLALGKMTTWNGAAGFWSTIAPQTAMMCAKDFLFSRTHQWVCYVEIHAYHLDKLLGMVLILQPCLQKHWKLLS